MDIWAKIQELLKSEGCTWVVKEDIVYVTTPRGDVWDFTIPLPRRSEKKAS